MRSEKLLGFEGTSTSTLPREYHVLGGDFVVTLGRMGARNHAAGLDMFVIRHGPLLGRCHDRIHVSLSVGFVRLVAGGLLLPFVRVRLLLLFLSQFRLQMVL